MEHHTDQSASQIQTQQTKDTPEMEMPEEHTPVQEGLQPSEQDPALLPVQAGERIVFLDVLRGFALFGILLINIVGFAWPMVYAEILKRPMFTESYDLIAENIVTWLVQGKFYTMFSLLFGIGFMIFITKAAEKGREAKPLFMRRVRLLLLIGILNAFLLWWGDILIAYALCGMLLAFFYKKTANVMLYWALGLSGGFMLMLFSTTWNSSQMSAEVNPDREAFNQQMIRQAESFFVKSFDVYGQGTFGEIMLQRAIDWAQLAGNLLIFPFIILPIFLIGAYAYKSGMLQRMQADDRVLKMLGWQSAVLGIVFTVLKEWCNEQMKAGELGLYETGYIAFGWYGDLGLAVFYAVLLIWLIRVPALRPVLLSLQWAGRMALTNYLMQAVICSLIFYSYGLGLYGKVGAALLIPIAIAIYLLQVWYSRWWFTRYTYGPAEWLWRKGTYGRLSSDQQVSS